MENLIIHPQDLSTVFLKPIYEKIENKTVIEKDASPEEVEELIKKSDRVMMMGHGSPSGLFSINLFSGHRKPYAISDEEVGLLRGKDQNIYIWCNANQFINANNLRGFYSGMFISEVYEAYFCGLRDAKQDMVDESNRLFSEIVGENISFPKEELYEKVVKGYGTLARSNSVAAYNLERLFVR